MTAPMVLKSLIDSNQNGSVDGTDVFETKYISPHGPTTFRRIPVSEYLGQEELSIMEKYGFLTDYAKKESMSCSFFRSVYLIFKYSKFF